jgi:hypothetical protein
MCTFVQVKPVNGVPATADMLCGRVCHKRRSKRFEVMRHFLRDHRYAGATKPPQSAPRCFTTPIRISRQVHLQTQAHTRTTTHTHCLSLPQDASPHPPRISREVHLHTRARAHTPHTLTHVRARAHTHTHTRTLTHSHSHTTHTHARTRTHTHARTRTRIFST